MTSVVTDFRELDATVTGQQPSSTPQSYLGRAAAAIARSAERYKVSPAYLWGIFGTETSYGSNITTSSTGAKGAFQFEPGTAKEYGNPLKNTSGHITDWQGFQAESDAAARLLVAYGYRSNKRRAIERYNTGPAAPAGAGRSYYESVVRHAQTYARVGPGGGEQLEKEKIIEGAKSPGGLKLPSASGPFAELIAGLGGIVVTGVLVIAGMALVAFGIFTALRGGAARELRAAA